MSKCDDLNQAIKAYTAIKETTTKNAKNNERCGRLSNIIDRLILDIEIETKLVYVLSRDED